MMIGGLQRTSTLDFPGVLCCVIFTRGCDLDCFYCHNRELLGAGETTPQEEILAFLKKRQGLLDGVVISGGEPTLQKDLREFILTIRDMGYKVKLDTNGQHPDVVEALCREHLLDYVAVDVKALPGDYHKVCGAGEFDTIRRTLDILEREGTAYEVRTTLYPGFTLENLKTLFSMLPTMPRWRLNTVNRPAGLRPQDEHWFTKPTLTAPLLLKEHPELFELQPNLIS